MFTPSAVTVVALLLLPALVTAAVAVGPATVHPDHPSRCWLPEVGVALPPGMSHTLPASCTRVTCYQQTATAALYVEYASCGLVTVGEGCMKFQKKDAPYPDCCPQGLCPRSDTHNFNSPEYQDFTNWMSQHYDYDIV